ncbi:hypothetical protein AUR04nite_17310 [Glutamicibacter uratoxydans]|uniref:ABC-2 type transporter transmembrane domain-containing protein n=1 Tax=Glutamicibacter uratoxydans TaxID=43667 RepID=A0A4Y4DLK1_GLUUR|nr:YhgE/Pip domain-containing protein [Glutamicibacter uratoxydans]GED06199.1 hypothetical protein AUR04nite_17310 [Glutamicibacter uratoxydans]
MTTLRLALSELKRMSRGTLPKLALIAITLVPLLYGALYLYANWDPQSNLNNVTAAVVNLDEGATVDKEFKQVGNDVVDSLEEDGTFGWAHLDTKAEAEDAVASGKYAFALILPKDFTAALTSPAELKDAKQANMELLTNDANNFMVGNFAKTLSNEVRTSVAKEVGTETASGMIAGFVEIHGSMGKAADGAEQLYDGTISLGDGVVSLADGTTKLVDGSADLSDGAGQLKTGTSELSKGLNSLVDGQKQLSSGADQLAKGSKDLSKGAGDLSKGLNTLESKTATLPKSVSQLNDGAKSAKAAADKLAAGSKQVADGNVKLSNTADDAIGVIDNLQADAESRMDEVKTAMDENLDQLVAQGVLTKEQASAIRKDVNSAVKNSSVSKSVQAEAKKIRNELGTVQSSLNQLADGSVQVADGNKQLAAGLGTLSQGTGQLNAAVPALREGIVAAADGGGKLADGSKTLASGASTLAEGQKAALDGAKQAAAGAKKLDTGAGALVDGSGQLHDGLTQLSDGVGELSKGADKLQDGSGELSTGLKEGVDEVPSPDKKTSEKLSDVIGDPVAVNQVKQAEAHAYGEGLAPFFMTLATFIGILILTQVMRPITNRALASNGVNWKIAIGGWLPFAFLAMIQTSLLFAVVHFGLGLTTAHPWLTWGLFLLAALCFSALIQGIYALLGTAGKFVVLVLMVLQLVTAGGTFPWETLPQPLHILHQILPMSSVVDAMRHLMYGAELSVLSSTGAVLIGYTLLGLLFSFLAVRKHKVWNLKSLQPELGE